MRRMQAKETKGNVDLSSFDDSEYTEMCPSPSALSSRSKLHDAHNRQFKIRTARNLRTGSVPKSNTLLIYHSATKHSRAATVPGGFHNRSVSTSRTTGASSFYHDLM